MIHLKEFLKFTKQNYLEEIKSIKIEIKKENQNNDKLKSKNKLNILNEEYKMLVSQKIKELASATNQFQKEIIENTYKELEEEKRQSIYYLQTAIESDKKKSLEESVVKLKTAVEYFDDIINSEEPNRMMLQMVIDRIFIDRDKTIRFELKPDMSKILKRPLENV